MRRKEREKEEQLALANSLSRIILSSSDINEIGRGFAFELKELVPISWAAIGLIEKSRGLLRLFQLSPRLSSDWEPGDSIPLEDSPFAWLAQHKRALLEPDLATESLFWTGVHWLKRGIRTIVYMPLFSGGEIFGGLIFGSNRPKAYGDRELKLLKYATSQIAAPIRHSEKFIPIIEEEQHAGRLTEEWMARTEKTLQELTAAITEYAVHLKSHTAAIQDLREASQELRQSAAEQNRVLSNLVAALTQSASGVEAVTVEGQEPVPPPEKDIHPPGCYYSQRRPVRPKTLAEKQRELLEKRIAGGKGTVKTTKSGRPGTTDTTEVPTNSTRYRRRLPPPL